MNYYQKFQSEVRFLNKTGVGVSLSPEVNFKVYNK